MPTARIQAMDSDNLFERLKLASHTLKLLEQKLKTQLLNAGVDVTTIYDNNEKKEGGNETNA